MTDLAEKTRVTGMKWTIIIWFSMAFSAQAAELTENKKAIIDELIIMTGAAEIARTMTGQFEDIMLRTMAQQYPQLSEAAKQAIVDETADAVKENMIENEWFNHMQYDLYSKYFTESELSEMLAFYKTATGRKATKVLPQLMQESMIVGGAKAQALAPVILERVQNRLHREGLLQLGSAP